MSLNFIMHKYRFLGKKGEGTFSEVLKCQNTKDGSYWACKKMKQTYESLEQVNNLREIQAMRRLHPHSNILELHEVLFDKKSGTLVLICELMDMNVYEMIRGRRQYLPEKRIRMYMYQLLKSIDYMHRHGIFHRDVKPENILIKEDLLKLADFGSCRSVYSKQPYTEYISTRWYRAPECLLTDGYYTYKMDIWSVGCVFFEVMSLHPLFPGSNEVDQIAKIHDILGTPDPGVINKLRNKTRGMNFNFPQKKGTGIEKMLPHASQDCVDLIYQMCTYDPDERITAKQGLRHPYFREFREAEKRAAAHAKAEKLKQQQQQQQQQQEQAGDENTPVTSSPRESLDNKKTEKKSVMAIQDSNIPEEKTSEDAPRKGKIPRPGSGGHEHSHHHKTTTTTTGSSSTTTTTTVPRYPGSLLHHHHHYQREPVFQPRLRRRKKTRRVTESGPNPLGSTTFSFPKVTQKPSSYQPSYHSSLHGGGGGGAATTTTTTTTSTLPKMMTHHNYHHHHGQSSTFFPTLTQAFVKPAAKPKGTVTKNMYGHYQLPSIDRRGAPGF